MTDAEENEEVFTIKPSQWINIGWFILPVIAGAINLQLGGVALVIAIYKYFEVDMWTYKAQIKSIEEKRGVFNVSQQEVRYFRIKSIMVDEPLWMRLFGLSIVRVITSEQYKPVLVLYAISNGYEVKNFLSNAAHEWRKELNIRDCDIYNYNV